MKVRDKFARETVVETGVVPVKVSTVKLHYSLSGGEYETCLFSKHGSHVVDRYRTVEDAESGHEEWIQDVRSGEVPVHLLSERGRQTERRPHTTEVDT